ncbi:MAG TPA: hypothetical protein VN228_22125 [Pyrinomonadaceae bacterium]|nr:hypothetical protein [Pyrinomonadaceae bacterium]
MKFQAHLPRLGAALLLYTLAAATTSPTPAAAQATTITTNETIPFTDTRTNPCNQDLVTFSGNLHITNHVTTDSSGGSHVRSHVNYQNVSGTGAPSGANYIVRTTTNETLNDNDGLQSELTVIQVVRLITQGSAPNFQLQIVLHITVNANGQTTSEVTESRIICRG